MTTSDAAYGPPRSLFRPNQLLLVLHLTKLLRFASQGRRTEDDERQIGRWQRCAGIKGRWRNNLVTKVYHSKKQKFDDPSVSPVVRQTLLHWAYELTKEDYDAQAKIVAKRK